MGDVDQQTRRRMGKVGLTAYDKEKAWKGYTFYAPPWSTTAYLLDAEGNEVFTWSLPYEPGHYGYLLPNNNLFLIGKVPDDGNWDLFPDWSIWKGGALLEIDPSGKVVWDYRDANSHHDARRTDSGGAIYIAVERMPAQIAKRVKGGFPVPSDMFADVYIEVDSSGKRVWEWHASEHLDTERYELPPNIPRTEWTHGNTIVPIGEDLVMISMRHVSLVALIDKKTGAFIWELGDELLAGQHDGDKNITDIA